MKTRRGRGLQGLWAVGLIGLGALGAMAVDLLTLDDGGSVRLVVVDDGRVGMGTSTPNAAALLDLSSTTRGLLIPRLTAAERDAIASPPAGLQIYNTTDNVLELYNGTQWTSLLAANITPVLGLGTADGTSMVLTYTVAHGLDTGSTPANGDYAVASSGPAQVVTAVVVGATTVTLTLSPGLSGGETVTVSYTPGTNKIQDRVGGAPAGSLVNQAITNDTSPPELIFDNVNAAQAADTQVSAGRPDGTRAGQVFDDPAYAGLGKRFLKVKLRLARGGAPTGLAQITVRDSADVIRATVDFDVTQLTTSFANYEVTLNVTHMLALGDRVLVEYTGGDFSNYVRLVFSAGVAQSKHVQYPGSYTDTASAASNITFDSSP